MSYLNQMYGQNSGKTPVNSYTDPRTGTIYFDNLPFNNSQQGLLSSPEYDSNGDLVDPRLQQQFQDNFNPANYTPSTIGPAPVLAPKPEPEQADPNAAVPAPILEVQPDVETVADPAVPPPALSRYEMSFGEKMGRYGGNIMNAGAKGGMAQVGAMGTTVGEIAGIERKQNQQLEENEIARMAKLKTSSAALDQLEQMRAMDNTKSKFDSALAGFIKYGDTVTGPIDSSYQAFKDSTGLPLPFGAPPDPERAAFVLSLKDIIVNDTLLKTAMTKGAISNAEMALFQQGIPNMGQQESVWIAWLTARRQNIEMIQDRIRNGTRVGLDSGVGFANAYTAPGSGSSSPASSAPSALTQAQLDAMAKNTPK
jgi:hypothetical protein